MENQAMNDVEWKISATPIPYLEAVAFMETRVADILAAKAPPTIWLLEHEPLYTGGTSAEKKDLLNQDRFPVYETGRGGQYTYHGPGQRVAYVMLDVKKLFAPAAPDIRKFVWLLEEWIIATLVEFGVTGERREGRIGIWVKTGESEAKIAAIGIRLKKWVSLHGIAINLNPDLAHYEGIVPCGISDYGVTSLHALGKKITMAELDQALQRNFRKIIGRNAK